MIDIDVKATVSKGLVWLDDIMYMGWFEWLKIEQIMKT